MSHVFKLRCIKCFQYDRNAERYCDIVHFKHIPNWPSLGGYQSIYNREPSQPSGYHIRIPVRAREGPLCKPHAARLRDQHNPEHCVESDISQARAIASSVCFFLPHQYYGRHHSDFRLQRIHLRSRPSKLSAVSHPTGRQRYRCTNLAN